MATFRLTRAQAFPVGTELSVYPLGNWTVGRMPSAGAPVGLSVASATVDSNGIATFTGLDPETYYVAHAQVGGVEKYVYFQTGLEQATSYVVTVETTPTRIARGPGAFVARNETDTAAIFLGDAGVTTSSYEWESEGLEYSFDLSPGEELYGIVASGTQTVHVLRTSK